MGIEGRLRDLGLTEVLQLLAVGRKSGTLHCAAPLLGRRVRIGFLQGMIVQAAMEDTAGLAPDAPAHTAASWPDGVSPPVSSGPTGGVNGNANGSAVGEVVREALRWRDGTFRFAPADMPRAESPLRLAVEPLLMESAQQVEVWSRIEARVPHARVVPAFSDIEPQQLPLLRLTPPQWEILTQVDGQRDITALAESMQREPVEIAELVHDLIVAGLLVLRDAPAAPRRNPTPPVNPVVPGADDLWIPETAHGGGPLYPGTGTGTGTGTGSGIDDGEDDPVFDPVQWGVLTADGMPRRATPWPPARVAPSLPEPSLDRKTPGAATAEPDGPTLQRLGEECARRGDLLAAITHWAEALDAPVPVVDADRVREALQLATRLHALLYRA